MKNLILQYLGFLNTPALWMDATDFGIQQIALNPKVLNFNTAIDPKLRLGKLVERFVSYQLDHDESCSILTENIQIQDGKLTLGELDCLMKENDQPIHLEIVYKFYLYDETVGPSEIDNWIGPNRKDSLTQKINKLKAKQLPLLYHNLTKPLLQRLDLQAEEIQQRVCFKAQLFVPWQNQNQTFKSINNSCIKGFYIKQNELEQFAACQFYLPKKSDWLMDAQIETSWLSFKEFITQLHPILKEERSPLCWIKKPNGEMQKCFIVWWE